MADHFWSRRRLALVAVATVSMMLSGCMGAVVVAKRGLLAPPRIEEPVVASRSGPFPSVRDGFDLFSVTAASAPDQAYIPKPGSKPRLALEGVPELASESFVVADSASGELVAAKNPDAVVSIASITKLMTAMVTLDAQLPLNEALVVSEEDQDNLKFTRSRLGFGTTLTRGDMLKLALMSSENRAASALGRHYPGGRPAFIAAMNAKAAALGLTGTRFVDSNGLNPANVSTPRDLVTMVTAASDYGLIREFSTASGYRVDLGDQVHSFHNTNALVGNPDWNILVQKTGFINEAGRCLVMEARLLDRPVVMVLMDSEGRYSRIEDAVRVRRWLEEASRRQVATAKKAFAG